MRECKFWNGKVGCEIDGVLWTILDVNGNLEALPAKLGGLTRGIDHIEEDRGVGCSLHGLVGLNSDASLVQDLLVEVERNWDLADVGQSEGLLGGLGDDNVAEIAHIGRNVDVLQVD